MINKMSKEIELRKRDETEIKKRGWEKMKDY